MIIIYIDFENITVGLKKLGYHIDWQGFLGYIKGKYRVDQAKIFIGHISTNQQLYDHLTSLGYVLIFRDAVIGTTGRIKANIDTNIVLEAMRDYYEYGLQQAILASCDGDFDCLVQFRYDKGIFKRLFATTQGDISLLLKRYTRALDITYMTDLEHKFLEQIKKDP